MEYTPAVKFENERLFILDQSLLPGSVNYFELTSLEQVYDAIKKLKVRGAPAIGIVAAYALYLTALDIAHLPESAFLREFKKRSEYLAGCRPTAVNLKWAVERMIQEYLYQHESRRDARRCRLRIGCAEAPAH